MIRHHITAALLLLGICTASHGCKPTVSTLTWEEIDVKAAFAEMRYPTGLLTYAASPPFQRYLGAEAQRQVSRALTMAATLAKLAEAAGTEVEEDAGADWDGGLPDVIPPTDTEVTSNSTTLFLEIACPGPYAYNIGQDFNNGLLRIDSGDLSDFSLRDMRRGAHLLLQFKACQVPGDTIEGSVPAYMRGGFKGILLDAAPLELEKGEIKAKYAYTQGSNTSLLVKVKGEGTYRLDSIVEGDKVETNVVAANGTISCHFGSYGAVFSGCLLE